MIAPRIYHSNMSSVTTIYNQHGSEARRFAVVEKLRGIEGWRFVYLVKHSC